MPYEIPIGLPSNLGLQDPPLSAVANIPELWKPKEGPWTIQIPLSTDAACEVKVLVELVQDQSSENKGLVVIASDTFTVNDVVTTYPLSISDTSELLKGTCSTAGMQIRVSATGTSNPCCPGCVVPRTLTAEITSAGPCPNCNPTGSTGQLTFISDRDGWMGDIATCDGAVWSFQMVCDVTGLGMHPICSGSPSPTGKPASLGWTCDPFEAVFEHMEMHIIPECNCQPPPPLESAVTVTVRA
ncbi:MAG: hypothetical protein JWP89_386 [Schlesneria sp.]|nr:hypothetical protein [Schlesneria sp.]